MSNGSAHEAINCLGAVLGGSLAGIDKSNQFVAAAGQYYNFALMEQQYYNKTNGENMVLNYTATQSGYTFWYEVFPPLLFCQLLGFSRISIIFQMNSKLNTYTQHANLVNDILGP